MLSIVAINLIRNTKYWVSIPFTKALTNQPLPHINDWIREFQNALTIGVTKRDDRDAHLLPWCPNSFIFMQFLAQKLQNDSLAHQLWESGAPRNFSDKKESESMTAKALKDILILRIKKETVNLVANLL